MTTTTTIAVVWVPVVDWALRLVIEVAIIATTISSRRPTITGTDTGSPFVQERENYDGPRLECHSTAKKWHVLPARTKTCHTACPYLTRLSVA
jgi:hypothetical protein